MAKLDLWVVSLVLLILGIGWYLARTPYDYFVTVLLAVNSALIIVGWFWLKIVLDTIQDKMSEIRERFGG